MNLMHFSNVKPNSVAVVSFLPTVVYLSFVQQGMEIHGYIIKHGLESNIYVGNALIDKYEKCGSVDDACNLFDKMNQQNVVSWTSMISGYTANRQYGEALNIF